MAEAFARALARSGTIRDPMAWIYRTAFRLANEELRAERRRGPAPTEEGAPPTELSGLIEALRRLSPNQRAAIVLRHVLDLDIPEVAHRMGTATPTVRVHIHRGRKKLRELLGAEEVDDA
jgi:RNA polymerase sigma-70 factor (ECF subfamily)